METIEYKLYLLSNAKRVCGHSNKSMVEISKNQFGILIGVLDKEQLECLFEVSPEIMEWQRESIFNLEPGEFIKIKFYFRNHYIKRGPFRKRDGDFRKYILERV